MQQDWSIKKRLPSEEIEKNLARLNNNYSGKLVQLKFNGDNYRISHFSILSHNQTAEYAVNYHPYSPTQQRDFYNEKHTRPAREFFDGRFDI